MNLADCFMELMAYTACLCQGRMETPPTFEEARRHIDALIENNHRDCAAAGFEERWEEALFAVCAWIDETVLCSEWSERDRWQDNQLQLVHFRTTNAGNEFFTRLNALEPEDLPVREVFAYCLALGFKGRYYLPEDNEKLQEIRSRNMYYLREDREAVEDEKLFPEAYSDRPGPAKRKRWLRGLSLYGILIVVISILGLAALFSTYKTLLVNMLDQSRHEQRFVLTK